VPDTRTLAFDNDPSAGGYDPADGQPVDPYAGYATDSYPPSGYPNQYYQAEQRGRPGAMPDKEQRRMSPLAIAGTVGAIVVSIGLALALLSPVFAGRTGNNGKAPTLPGVLEDPGPGPSAPAAQTPPADAPSDLPSEPPTATPDPTDRVVTGNTGAENAVVALVNNERRKRKKCDPVQNDDRLRDAARRHSADMATGGFLKHNGSDGSSPDDRMQAAGVDDPLSENLARGFRSADDVVDAWMKSKAQRGNILDCDARSIGVGVAVAADGTPYWTQNFGE
jgi:uncharacterized protein YkwD